MDWTQPAMWIVYAGLVLWNLTAGYFLVTAWRDWLGRRRDQRRTGKRLLFDRKFFEQRRQLEQEQTNGATSSERMPGTPPTQRRS